MRWLHVAFTAGIGVLLVPATPAALEPAVTDGSAMPDGFRPFSVGIGVDGPESTAVRHTPGMIAEADAIWRAYGVRVVLLPARARETAPCDVRLTLRFESARAPAPGSVGSARLGSIWFHDGGIPSQTIAIEPDGRELAGWDRGVFRLEASALPRLRARVARLALFPEPLEAADHPPAARPN